MSNRIRFVSDAKLTTEMLNDAFDFAEEAEQRILSDLGVRGILYGLEASAAPGDGLRLSVSPGIAYDTRGRRVHVDESQVVDCQPTVVDAHQEVWLSICFRFAVRKEDPFLSASGETVWQRVYEFFEVSIRRGEPAAIGTAAKPILGGEDVLVCDVLMQAGQCDLTAESIDTTRRSHPVLWRAKYLATDAFHWRSLSNAPTVQAALDAADKILHEQANASGVAVDSTGWNHRPEGASVQQALTDIDATLTTLAGDASLAANRADKHDQNIAAIGAKVADQDQRIDSVSGAFHTRHNALSLRTDQNSEALVRTSRILHELTVSPRVEAERLDQFLLFPGELKAPYPTGDVIFATVHVPGLATEDRILSIVPQPPFGERLFCKYRSHVKDAINVQVIKMGSWTTAAIPFFVFAAYSSEARKRGSR